MNETPNIKVLQQILDVNEGISEDDRWQEVWWCGTRGCWIGNACMAHPEWEMKLVPHEDIHYARQGYVIPFFRGRDRHVAVSDFAGITLQQSIDLFGPDAIDIESRLRAFIDQHREHAVIELKPECPLMQESVR